MSAYKIASPEITDFELLIDVAKTNKPVILSTGLAKKEDIDEAVKVLRSNGALDIAILKCTTSYPAPFSEINLRTITDYMEEYNCLAGISDHTIGDSIPIASVALGGKIVEKHFMIKKKITADSFFQWILLDLKNDPKNKRSGKSTWFS